MNSVDNSWESRLKILEHYAQRTGAFKSGAGYYYIIWGICLSIYFLIFFLISQGILPKETSNWSWLLFPATGWASIWTSKRLDDEEQAIPQQDRVHKYIWIAISILLAIEMVNARGAFHELIFQVACLMAVASFLTGGIFSFKPGSISSLLGLMLGIAIPFLSFPWACLMASISLIFSLILPGIFMISKYPSRV
jgi:hypothetical protein